MLCAGSSAARRRPFFGAPEEEKESRFFPRFKQVLAEWEELGERRARHFQAVLSGLERTSAEAATVAKRA